MGTRTRKATDPMQDTRKTKKQLIQELVALQQRLAIYEAVDMQRQQATDVLPASAAHFCRLPIPQIAANSSLLA